MKIDPPYERVCIETRITISDDGAGFRPALRAGLYRNNPAVWMPCAKRDPPYERVCIETGWLATAEDWL